MEPDPRQLVEHFFRHEYGRQVALLTRSLGLKHLELVEDVVQTSMSRALQSWGQRGLPSDPAAWLYRTARNLAIDTLRRQQTFSKWCEHESREQNLTESAIDSFVALLDDPVLVDETLRMLFLCCHPEIPLESRVALALKTVSGFQLDEIADALLITSANAEKRVSRAKQKLRELGVEIVELDGVAVSDRWESVEATLYLIFTEGYASQSSKEHVRRDLCEEAIRLTRMMASQHKPIRPSTAALLSLMLFHTARLDSRLTPDGLIITLEHQDRSIWNWNDIREAMNWMAQSAQGDELTRFHLESAIAWEHCRAESFDKVDWNRITELYDLLIEQTPSPMIRVNQAIAHAWKYGWDAGLKKLLLMPDPDRVKVRPWWDCAVAECFQKLDQLEFAIAHWTDALALATNPSQHAHIEQKLKQCHSLEDGRTK